MMPRAAATTLHAQQERRARSLVPHRVSRVRPLFLLLGFATGCATAMPAISMTLGGITEQSQLGEPLRIVIPVSTQSAEELSPDCVKIAPSPARSVDDVPEISSATLALERGAGSARLVVTTRRPVNDPVIRITVQAGCEEEIRREYLMLLDPPVMQTAVAEASAHPPVRPSDPASNEDSGSMSVAALPPRVESQNEPADPPQSVTTPKLLAAPPEPLPEGATRVSKPVPRKPASSRDHSPRLAISRSLSEAEGGQPASFAPMSKSAQLNAVQEQEVVLRKRVEELTILVERMQQERIALLSAEVERLQSDLRTSEAARRAAENDIRSSPVHAIAQWNTENWPLAASVFAIAGLTGAGVYVWRRRKPHLPMPPSEPPLMSPSDSGIVDTYLDDLFHVPRPLRSPPPHAPATTAPAPHEQEFDRDLEDSGRSARIGDLSRPADRANAPNADAPQTLQFRSA